MRVSNWVSLSCSAFGPSDTTSGPTLSPANCANVFPMLFLGGTVSPLPFRAVLDVSPLADGTRSFLVSSECSSPVYSNSSSYLSSPRAALFSRHPKARILKGPRGGKGNSRASSFFSFPGRFGAFCSSFSSSESRSLSSSLYDVVFRNWIFVSHREFRLVLKHSCLLLLLLLLQKTKRTQHQRGQQHARAISSSWANRSRRPVASSSPPSSSSRARTNTTR